MEERINKVKNSVIKLNLDALLISTPANILYLTGYANFSNIEREAFILITNYEQYLLTDGRYIEAVKTQIPHLTPVEYGGSQPFKKVFKDLLVANEIKKIGFEKSNLTYAEFEQKNSHVKASKATFIPTDNIVETIRMIKTPEEIKKIKQACEIGDKAFEYITKKIKVGMSEKEIAREMELFVYEQGATLSFDSIVAFGKNAAIPHHATSNEVLTNQNLVLLDFGVKYEGYCSDMTRTIFMKKATDKQKRVYQTVLEAQQKALDYLSAGKKIQASDVDREAREYIISQGFPSIPHSVGHGIGLEVHENPHLSPNSKDKLVTQMVFSVEPGIYQPGVGGVRIEDLVTITHYGIDVLTHSPKDLIELS